MSHSNRVDFKPEDRLRKTRDGAIGIEHRGLGTSPLRTVRQDLGLNDDEIAFYYALAERPEVLRTMGDATLKQLATELTEQLRNRTTVDW